MARRRPTSAGGPVSEPPAGSGDDHDRNADPDSVARTICLRLLSVRARTRAELHEALIARGTPVESAGRVLDRFVVVGLVDDRAFAQRFVETRHQDRGLASRELRRQLRDKGVDDSIIHEATELVDSEQELATARRLVERKLASMSRLDRQVQARRLAGMLARKGYSPGTAFQVVREVMGDRHDLEAGADSDDTAWLA